MLPMHAKFPTTAKTHRNNVLPIKSARYIADVPYNIRFHQPSLGIEIATHASTILRHLCSWGAHLGNIHGTCKAGYQRPALYQKDALRATNDGKHVRWAKNLP